MPAYIIETGRSYPNPVDSEDYDRTYTSDEHPSFGSGYQIEIEGSGPGSYAFGRDEVFYIGDPTETCVEFCDADRRAVYRFYSGRWEDHFYYHKEKIPKDIPQERKRYNIEPRNGQDYFQLNKSNVSGSIPVYVAWNGGDKNSYLSTSGGQKLLGYGFPSVAAATSAGVSFVNEMPTALYHYRKNADGDVDDFYTINPAVEVNLSGGPIPPREARQGEYVYQGIFCYVWTGGAPRNRKRVETSGKAYNTGEVDRNGWYQYNQTWSKARYHDEPEATPAQEGWGDPNNAELISTNANFEWFYGKNGAVKAAMPRFLGFHDCFEGQFVYYLYDTSFPFNGPIYGINFTTTDAPCCPQRSQTECVPNVRYHSLYYEMREDAWVTKRTSMTVDSTEHGSQGDSFWTVGTDEEMIFFRYTSSTGAFRVGEQLNNWTIMKVRYFGDELKCGYMKLFKEGKAKGNEFTYQQNITSADGATGIVLAGYGIKDKVAFFGVYEFPKKLSYYRVEIDNKALIPKRTLDVAVLKAIINNKGQIGRIEIVNAGKDYVNPSLIIGIPDVVREEGFADTAKNVPEAFEDDFEIDYAINLESSDEFDSTERAAQEVARNIQTQQYITEDNFTGNFRQAKGTVTVNEEGCVKSVTITDKGAGYQPGEEVYVQVVERETETREDIVVGDSANITDDEVQRSIQSGGIPDPEVRAGFDEMYKSAGQALGTLKNPIQTSYVTGYIKSTDIDIKEKTKFCDNVIPKICINPNIGENWHDINTFTDLESLWGNVSQQDPNWNQNNAFLASAKQNSTKNTGQINAKMTQGLRGIFGGDCIEMDQANLYMVKRFFDVPCPYTAFDTDGKERTYGWMPFKYCGSKKEEATIRVTMTIEGDVTGVSEAVNQRFLAWLKWLPKPTLTAGRPVTGGYKTHACTRGSNVKGRCYSTGNGQYEFVPTSGDENTFDFNGPGATLSTSNVELGQLSTWIGDNINVYTGLFFNQILVDANDVEIGQNNVPYTQLTLANCSGGKFPNDNWHNFVADGVLNVYGGYDSNGNGISASDPCNNNDFFGSCGFGNWALRNVIHSTIAFDSGKLSEDGPYIELGPVNGTMHWKNWATGSTRLLSTTLDNYGNPYFDECDLT